MPPCLLSLILPHLASLPACLLASCLPACLLPPCLLACLLLAACLPHARRYDHSPALTARTSLVRTQPDRSNAIVTLEWDRFDTEAGKDIVRIYDGPSRLDTPLHTGDGFSGAEPPPTFQSSAGAMLITFQSDGANAMEKGFRFSWSCTGHLRLGGDGHPPGNAGDAPLPTRTPNLLTNPSMSSGSSLAVTDRFRGWLLSDINALIASGVLHWAAAANHPPPPPPLSNRLTESDIAAEQRRCAYFLEPPLRSISLPRLRPCNAPPRPLFITPPMYPCFPCHFPSPSFSRLPPSPPPPSHRQGMLEST